MEKLRSLWSRVKEKLADEREWSWEKVLDKAKKEARSLDEKYQLSENLDFIIEEEKTFFVDCCLAREVALAEEKDIETLINLVYAEALRRGFLSARQIEEKQRLRPRPIKNPSVEIGELSGHITGEFLFENTYIFNVESPSLLPREREFRETKRSLLTTIAASAHLIFSLIDEGKTTIKSITAICQKQGDKISTERNRVIGFLVDPSLYREAFIGERGADFTDGTGFKKPPSYLK